VIEELPHHLYHIALAHPPEKGGKEWKNTAEALRSALSRFVGSDAIL
jgi:hypothetical protein